jgi:hypothetical protein
MLALVVGLVGAGFFGARRVVRDFEAAEEISREVTERFGAIGDFIPAADGAIPPHRIAVFLDIRNATASERENLEGSINQLSRGVEGRPDGIVGTIRSALGLLPLMAQFMASRNSALLEAEMGRGEYLYYYAVVYFAWLEFDVDDGPPFLLVNEGHGSGIQIDDDRAVLARRREIISSLLNRQLLPVLKNQISIIDETTMTEKALSWRTNLQAEVAAMEADSTRLPWQNGVPDAVVETLEPFRVQLENSYSPLCNPIEVGVEEN